MCLIQLNVVCQNDPVAPVLGLRVLRNKELMKTKVSAGFKKKSKDDNLFLNTMDRYSI